jgi:hypothetical protein
MVPSDLAAVGLNPELGILHTDVDSRRSMALDLIETIRPDIDRLAFQYFHQQVFSKSDFWETDRGSVRLGLEVRKAIIHNAFLLESRVREYAVQLRDRFSDYQTSGSRRRAVRMGDLEIVHVCEYCGTPLDRKGKLCDDCLEIQRRGNLSDGNALGFMWTETALSNVSKKVHANHVERLRWEAQFPDAEFPEILLRERQRFIVEIFPRLQSVPITQIAKKVGISLSYASLVKKGLNVPHPHLNSKFEECFLIPGKEIPAKSPVLPGAIR